MTGKPDMAEITAALEWLEDNHMSLDQIAAALDADKPRYRKLVSDLGRAIRVQETAERGMQETAELIAELAFKETDT